MDARTNTYLDRGAHLLYGTGSPVGQLVILLVANLYDTLSTAIAMEQGVEEANPLMAWVIEQGGIGGLLLFKLCVVALFFLGIKSITGWYLVVVRIVVAVYVALVLYHWHYRI